MKDQGKSTDNTSKAKKISRRDAVFYLATASVAASGIVVGCSGSLATATGAATISIEWPDRSRLIPDASESITVSFLNGTTVVASQTVARPTSSSSTTVSFSSLVAGDLTLKAEAFPTTTGTGTAQASATKAITITSGVTSTLSITMDSTIGSLSITPTNPTVQVGSTIQLAMTALNSSGGIVLTSSANTTWTSLSTSIASVSTTGLVTGLAAGTAQIQVTESESGVSATVSVTVSTASVSCHLIPSETDGPYPLYSVLSNSAMNRSSVNESKTGVPLTIELVLVNVNGTCTVIPNAYIYIWHCDKDGEYSGYNTTANGNHLGETFCRGIQQTDSMGKATFTTIYPGWYTGRITHVHFQVYLTSLSSTVTATSQLAFPQAITQAVYNSTLYAAHGQNSSVPNFASDNVFSDGTTYQLATVTGSVAAGYTATLTIGINA